MRFRFRPAAKNGLRISEPHLAIGVDRVDVLTGSGLRSLLVDGRLTPRRSHKENGPHEHDDTCCDRDRGLRRSEGRNHPSPAITDPDAISKW